MKFAGKCAVISGAARGIGRATALKLAAEGAKVALLDINAEGLDAVAESIRSAGGTAPSRTTPDPSTGPKSGESTRTFISSLPTVPATVRLELPSNTVCTSCASKTPQAPISQAETPGNCSAAPR